MILLTGHLEWHLSSEDIILIHNIRVNICKVPQIMKQIQDGGTG